MTEDVLGIEVHCHGIPKPKIKWFHDVIEIKPSFKYALLEEAQGVYKLEIYKPAGKDSGNYTCKAENSVAVAKIIHSVQFVGGQGHVHIPGIHHAHSELLKQKEEEAKRAMEEALKAKEEYESRCGGNLQPTVRRDGIPSIPQKGLLKFVNTLYDRDALVGNNVKFTCVVLGPEPNICWLKDGKEDDYGPDVKILTVEGTTMLEISDLALVHSGEYKCCASNNISNVSVSCQLKVYDARIKGENKEEPLFLESIKG